MKATSRPYEVRYFVVRSARRAPRGAPSPRASRRSRSPRGRSRGRRRAGAGPRPSGPWPLGTAPDRPRLGARGNGHESPLLTGGYVDSATRLIVPNPLGRMIEPKGLLADLKWRALTWSQARCYRDHMSREASVVGVRGLRARLSHYLREVARGETITIGDRRREPVARLVPVDRSTDHALLDRLAESGKVRRGMGKPGTLPPIKPKRRGRSVSDIVIADRG